MSTKSSRCAPREPCPASASERATIARRAFLCGGAAFVVAPGAFAAVTTSVAAPPLALKTHALYLGEAAEFDAGIRELSSALTITAASPLEQQRFRSVVAVAGARLDLVFSRMVAQCAADPRLVAWVRRELPDAKSFNAFVAAIQRDPTAVDRIISDIAAYRAQIAQVRAQAVSMQRQIAARIRVMSALEAAAAKQSEAAMKNAQQCQESWVIVAAVITIVATVVAVVTAGAAAMFTSADALARTYRGTGFDVVERGFRAANRRYQDCLAAAALLPPERRARAIATCQARWLEEKAALLA
jgi:hypothetical protein